MKNVLTLVAIIGVLLSPHAIAQTAPITPTTKIEHKANVAVVVTEKPATPSSIEKPIEVNPSERMYHPMIEDKKQEIREDGPEIIYNIKAARNYPTETSKPNQSK
jgi:hypothetical protein